MLLPKISKYGLLTLLVLFVSYFTVAGVVQADTVDTSLASNVKVSSTPNGGYQVLITDKPGYVTQVTMTCTASGCQNSSKSIPITEADARNLTSTFEFPQSQALKKLIQAQEALFQQQQQIFQSLWNIPGVI